MAPFNITKLLSMDYPEYETPGYQKIILPTTISVDNSIIDKWVAGTVSNKLSRRSRRYFGMKKYKSKLAITSWHLDWMKMAADNPHYSSNLAIMMPALEPLTHADGSIVQANPAYFNPLGSIHPEMNPLIESYEESWRKFMDVIRQAKPNQGESDERSVARNPSSET